MPVASALPLSNSALIPPARLPNAKTNSPLFIPMVCITLLGAVLRLWHLGSKSLWLDESATVALARMPWKHFTWVWWYGEANLQTIYFLFMRGWIHFGTSETWIRLPSALFGIAAIPVIYLVARRFTNRIAALAAAALLAISPTHVYYSQEARSYSLTILLVLLSAYFFVRAVEQEQRKDWLLWAGISVIAVYSHYFAALVLVAQAASLFYKQKPVPWRPVILGGIGILLISLPGLSYVFRATPENLHFIWMPRPTGKELWHLAMFFGGSGSKIAIAILLWAAGVFAILRSRRNDQATDRFWTGMLLLMWLLVPVILTALFSLRQPMFLQRYMIFSLPAAILLAAVGMDVLHKWKIGPILVVALCAMSIPAIVKHYRKPREDWRAATGAVLSSAAPGDAVVFFPFYTRITLDYYSDRYPTSPPSLHVFAPAFYAGGEDSRNLLQLLEKEPHGFRHVWILMADHGTKLSYFDYGAALDEKLQSVYGPPSVQKFADIDVLEYGR